MTRLIFRRVLPHMVALVIGAACYCVVFIINVFGEDALRYFIYSSALQSRSNYPLVAGWRDVFPFFAYGYPAAVAILAVYLFWDGFPSQRRRLVIYSALMGVIGPITFVNYTHADQFVSVWVQMVFNIFTIFVGYTIVLNLRAVTPASYDGLALQSLSILLVTAFAVALPMFYTGVFGLYAFGVIGHQTAQSLGDKTSLAIAGAIGALAAVIGALDNLRQRKVA
ncbi:MULTISPECIES: hypothetical protein [Bradyrhizobium]|uniref:hypothetical protein n=1 Tax=Bradyrhizobium TaxID=374 RepID=UPI001BA821D6|nr:MULTISPECIES: hypothetical protein [Bradyrhizobium]MBR1167766.1 hypothetical protein [Bradyrhizobium liaoningense]UWU68695.1 hypothetical protein N2602_37405 [Bradyrhizobium sp. NC92]